MLTKLTLLSSSVLARDMILSDLRADDHIAKPSVKGFFSTNCKGSVNRLKRGPEDWNKIIAAGEQYEDTEFKKRKMLYDWPYDDWWKSFLFDMNLNLWQTEFVRLGEAYPDYSMWGTSGVEFTDPR